MLAEVIRVGDDDEEPPRRDAGKGTATPTAPQATTQRMPPSGAPQVPPAPAMTVPPGQGSSQAGAGSVAAPSIALATAPTPPVNIFSLYKVPEDQTGASKEAMIQAELMTQRIKEVCAAGKLAYDASAALQENVRVSALVSHSPSRFSSVGISVKTGTPTGCFYIGHHSDRADRSEWIPFQWGHAECTHWV